MKTIRLILAVAMLVPFFMGSAQSGNKDKNSSQKIEAYYFHFTARCMTCQTVEERAKENLQDLYPEQWKAGIVTFRAANLNEKEGKALAEKLGVSGQTLLLMKGEKQVDLTNQAFLYAVTNPGKYKQLIRENVDKLLK